MSETEEHRLEWTGDNWRDVPLRQETVKRLKRAAKNEITRLDNEGEAHEANKIDKALADLLRGWNHGHDIDTNIE